MIIFNNATKSEAAFSTCLMTILLIVGISVGWHLTSPTDLHAREPGGVKTIVVMGTGKIQKDNTAAARELAINDSLVSAVSLTVTDIMPIEMINANFSRLNEAIYSQVGQFIQEYRVLSETKYATDYRVLVEVDIAVDRIHAYLANIGLDAGKMELPKLLFLMAERNIDDERAQYWWQTGMPITKTAAEQSMSEKMQKQGFVVLTPDHFPSSMDNAGLNTPEPSNAAALSLAKYFAADILILGSAFAEPAANSMEGTIRTYRGTVSARAIWVQTGEEVAVTYRSDAGVSPDPQIGGREAIASAGATAGEDLGLQIIAALKTHKKESSFITIVVKGAKLLTHLVKLRKALTEINDVQSILVSEMKAGEATLKVGYQKEPRQLAQTLLLKPFDGFGINIAAIGDDSMTIELIPAGRMSGTVSKDRPME